MIILKVPPKNGDISHQTSEIHVSQKVSQCWPLLYSCKPVTFITRNVRIIMCLPSAWSLQIIYSSLPLYLVRENMISVESCFPFQFSRQLRVGWMLWFSLCESHTISEAPRTKGLKHKYIYFHSNHRKQLLYLGKPLTFRIRWCKK